MKRPPVFIVMGVSGCGKSTVGKLLATTFQCPFFDGDDHHPEENIKKMAAGIPLEDKDREGWLKRLNQLALKNPDKSSVIACSALKKTYRKILSAGLEDRMEFVYLKGSKAAISRRLGKRKNHFMPPELLTSQFNTLEPPINALTVSITYPPNEIVKAVLKLYEQKKS